MSRDASVTLDWADRSYTFRLGWGQLAELQEKCDAGPFVVLQRLHDGSWRVEDISNVIRLGLIGGGAAPAEALTLSRRYVEARPPFENLMTAQAILSAGCAGAPDEDDRPKKAGAPDRADGSTISRTARSGSEPSTALAPSST